MGLNRKPSRFQSSTFLTYDVPNFLRITPKLELCRNDCKAGCRGQIKAL